MQFDLSLLKGALSFAGRLQVGGAFGEVREILTAFEDNSNIAIANLPFPLARVEAEPEFNAALGSVLSGREVAVTELQIGDFEFPIPPVISVRGVKRVVRTARKGQDYSVKEIVSAEDWQVNIRCFLLNDAVLQSQEEGLSTVDTSFPIDKLKQLIDLYRENQSLPVVCRYLNYVFGIRKLLITSVEPVAEFYQGAIAVEILAESDDDTELELQENNENVVSLNLQN